MRSWIGMLGALLTVAAAVAQVRTSDKPDALVQAELARTAIRTARIDWSIRWPMLAGAEGERTHFYTWRAADSHCALEQWGDDEGVFSRGEGYQPRELQFQNPEALLLLDGEFWHHEGRATFGRVWNRDRRGMFQLFDLRHLGLNPANVQREMISDVRSSGGRSGEYESSMDAGLFHVRAPMGDAEYHWWIDGDRDWNVVRTQVTGGGQRVHRECEAEIAQFDGRWFPKRLQEWRGPRSAGKLFRDIRIVAAEFNRSEHPQVLTPTSIGIEPGMPLQYMLTESPVSSPVWDGTNIVSSMEFLERVRVGAASFGPTLLRERARAVARSERLARAEGAAPITTATVSWRDIEAAWESYTRQVVEHYRLEEKQAEQAWRICADCQQQAREFIARHREKLAALDRVHGAPDAAANGDTPDTPAATDGAAPGGATAKHAAPERREELLGRIDEIFERRLKARLMTLPTDAQRAAAAKLPAIPEPRLIAVGEARRAEAPR